MKARTKVYVGIAGTFLVTFALMGGFSGAKTTTPSLPFSAGVTTVTPAPTAAAAVAGPEQPIATLRTGAKVMGNDSDLTAGMGSVRIWEASSDPTSSATGSNPVLTDIPPVASRTITTLFSTNHPYKAILSGPNIWPVSLGGVDTDNKESALPHSFTRTCTACDTITSDANFGKVRMIATAADILAENSPAGDQSINGQSSLNGTTQWRQNPTTQCLAVGEDSTPANGDTIFWNNTNCGGNLYVRFDANTGSTAYTWQYKPGLRFTDAGSNFSASAVSSASVAHFTTQGGQYPIQSVNLADIINQGRCILLYDPSNPSTKWVPENRVDTMRLNIAPNSASWATGMGFRMDLRNLVSGETCTGSEFVTTSNSTGPTFTNNLHRITIVRDTVG